MTSFIPFFTNRKTGRILSRLPTQIGLYIKMKLFGSVLAFLVSGSFNIIHISSATSLEITRILFQARSNLRVIPLSQMGFFCHQHNL